MASLQKPRMMGRHFDDVENLGPDCHCDSLTHYAAGWSQLTVLHSYDGQGLCQRA